MAFNQEDFHDFILDHGVVGFFNEPVPLKSDRPSHWYVNWRKPMEDTFLANELCEYVINFTLDHQLSPQCFYGVPEGATKIALLTQFKWAGQNEWQWTPGSHPLAMGRGKIKECGKPEDRYFLGMPRGDTIVIEDVTTTGGSLLSTLDALAEANVRVIAAFGLTNRMEKNDEGRSVEDTVQAKGVLYHALSTAHDILPKAYARLQPGKHIARAIEEEFAKYGVKPLRLRGHL